METKQKTPAECRDDYARSQGFNDWQDMKTGKMWDEYEQKNLDAATELYAGQTKQSDLPVIECCKSFIAKTDTSSATICMNCGREKFVHFQEHQSPEKWQPIEKSEPMSLEVEEQLLELFGNARSRTCVGIGGGCRMRWDYDLDDLKNKVIELLKQSQRPASIAFLSDEEIENLPFDYNYSEDNYMAMVRDNVVDFQNELRKRVIDLNEIRTQVEKLAHDLDQKDSLFDYWKQANDILKLIELKTK